VTGTNGKTTTAALVAHLLRDAGMEVGLGGNIGAAFGPPMSDLALLDPSPEWFVVEVSSFQLADIEDFDPAIGVVTNLAPDHLDRYADVASYYGDKARLFDNAGPGSTWVLNADDPAVEALAGEAPGSRFRFSAAGNPGADAVLRDGALMVKKPSGRPTDSSGPGGSWTRLISEEDLPLLGRHNCANALAAALTAALVGAPETALARGLGSFAPLPHRMETVGASGGFRWVNDSKATNVAATVSALESLDGPLVLLLGGKDKGEDFGPLREALHSGVRAVVLYGQARERLEGALAGTGTPLLRADGSFEEAVEAALGLGEPGDLLLLSPACSSFDMFENYEDRGRRFASLARGSR
jgi:UDP-N-acetylmuramoylalanine--D-glutamate ligase